MNNYQQEIANIFGTATSSIQIAVSWFTDEVLINCLIRKADKIKIELLLSSDEVNLLRHNNFKQLQSHGARVNKIGSDNALIGDFMHSKFIIIDREIAYGGSYNFTSNAKSNFENFNKLASNEVTKVLNNFNGWYNQSVNFFSGVLNAEDVVKRMKQKFFEEESRKQSLMDRIKNSIEFSETEFIQKKEEDQKVAIRNSITTVAMAQVFNDEIKKRYLAEND